MKILMVAPEQIPVPGNGSVEICMLAIAKQLAKRHHVTIVSRASTSLPRRSQWGNLTIVRVPSGSHRRYLASVLAYMQGRQFDMIQVDNRPHYMARVKKAFPQTPVSLFLHSLTFVPATAQVAASMKSADVVIANSDSLKRELTARFPRIASRIRVVYLGVDVDRFRPASKPRSSGFRVLFTGRVIPRKGVPVLIKAMRLVRKQFPLASLTVVGGGKVPYVQGLRALARKNGVPATFTGRIAHRRMDTVYRKADCFICPSQKHEAFGLVNVEAMASGLPVVASQIGGIKEIVRHGQNGYLVKSYKSPESFASYITKLARDRSLRDRLAAQARKDAIRSFGWSRTASKLSGIYVRQAGR